MVAIKLNLLEGFLENIGILLITENIFALRFPKYGHNRRNSCFMTFISSFHLLTLSHFMLDFNKQNIVYFTTFVGIF